MRRGQSTNSGFTLIEVMISVVIVSISVVSIYQAFIACLEGRISSENYNRATLLMTDEIFKFKYAQPDENADREFLDEKKSRLFEWDYEISEFSDTERITPSYKKLTFTMKWKGPGEHRRGQMSWIIGINMPGIPH